MSEKKKVQQTVRNGIPGSLMFTNLNSNENNSKGKWNSSCLWQFKAIQPVGEFSKNTKDSFLLLECKSGKFQTSQRHEKKQERKNDQMFLFLASQKRFLLLTSWESRRDSKRNHLEGEKFIQFDCKVWECVCLKKKKSRDCKQTTRKLFFSKKMKKKLFLRSRLL